MNHPPTLEVNARLENSLSAGHPWVYRDHVARGFTAETGVVVLVRAGGFSGYGVWDARSPIAVRMLASKRAPDARWVMGRVQLAWDLRAPLRAAGVTGYRWLNGEGDGLPGIVVDVYDGYAVVVPYADSMAPLLPWIVESMAATAQLRGCLRKAPSEGSGPRPTELLFGELPPDPLVIEEYGVKMLARPLRGQKTGLFLDQRENRRYVGTVSSGRRVLNLFSYTGGFSLTAARGGARRVVSVDSAPAAAVDAQENFRLNELVAPDEDFVVADAFEWLAAARERGERFDVVVCDPPSFAHNREQQHAAIRAYTKLNAAGIAVTETGGLYCASSCTAQVGVADFHAMLAEAARKVKRRFQIVSDVGHASDHPVFAGHPEGRYLKFVVGRILPLP